MSWKKLSASINYFINKNLWGEYLLESNEELLNQYMDLVFEEKDGVYLYLDKQTYEYIELSNGELEKIKQAFLERIEKKKFKYEDELYDIRLEKYCRDVGECLDIEFKNKLEGFK